MVRSVRDKGSHPDVVMLMLTYNSEERIRESIKSLLEQSFHSFRLYIFDDASTDKSREILESIDDSRLEIVQNRSNKGMTANFSESLRSLRHEIENAKYFLYAQHDDIYGENYLSECIEFLENNLSTSVVQQQFTSPPCDLGPHFFRWEDELRVQLRIFEYRGKKNVDNIHYVNSLMQGVVRSNCVFQGYGVDRNIEKELLISELLLSLSLRRTGQLVILDGTSYLVGANPSFQSRYPKDSFTLDRASFFKSLCRHLKIAVNFYLDDYGLSKNEICVIVMNFLHEEERFRSVKRFLRSIKGKSRLNRERELFQKGVEGE